MQDMQPQAQQMESAKSQAVSAPNQAIVQKLASGASAASHPTAAVTMTTATVVNASSAIMTTAADSSQTQVQGMHPQAQQVETAKSQAVSTPNQAIVQNLASGASTASPPATAATTTTTTVDSSSSAIMTTAAADSNQTQVQGMQPQAQQTENAKSQTVSAPNQAIVQNLASGSAASPRTAPATTTTATVVSASSATMTTAAADSSQTQVQRMQPQAQQVETANAQAVPALNQAVQNLESGASAASPPTTAAVTTTAAVVCASSATMTTAVADSRQTQVQDTAVSCAEASTADQQRQQNRQNYLQYSGYIAFLQQYQLHVQYQHQIHRAQGASQQVLTPGQHQPQPSMWHHPHGLPQTHTQLLPQQRPQQQCPQDKIPPGQYQRRPYIQYQLRAPPQTKTQTLPQQPPRLHVPAQLPHQTIPSMEMFSSNQPSHLVFAYEYPHPIPGTRQRPMQMHTHQDGMPRPPQHPQTQGQYPPRPSDAHMAMRVCWQPPMAPPPGPTTNLHLGQQEVKQAKHQPGVQPHASQPDFPHPQVQGHLHSGHMHQGPLPSTDKLHPQQPLKPQGSMYIEQHVPGHPFPRLLADRQAQGSPIVPTQCTPQQPFQQPPGDSSRHVHSGHAPNQTYPGRSNPCVPTFSELQLSPVSPFRSRGTVIPELHRSLPTEHALFGHPSALKMNDIPNKACIGGMHTSAVVRSMAEEDNAPQDPFSHGNRSEFKEDMKQFARPAYLDEGRRFDGFMSLSRPSDNAAPHLSVGDSMTTSRPLPSYQSGTPFPPSSGGSVVTGPDIPNIISHDGAAEGCVFSSNIHGKEAAGFGGFHSQPGISEHGGSGNLHRNIRFDDPCFDGRFNSVSFKGDVDSIEQSRKRKPGSMVWCRLCNIDCKTVEGLNLHSQTRDHQKTALDLVLRIKQDNAKKHKLTPDNPKPFEVGKNLFMGNVDSIEQSRDRKPGSMSWCHLCNIDCKTVEGLDLHSQTREHQKMAMDWVLGIKQDNAKKHKLTPGNPKPFEDGKNSRKANFENHGKRE